MSATNQADTKTAASKLVQAGAVTPAQFGDPLADLWLVGMNTESHGAGSKS